MKKVKNSKLLRYLAVVMLSLAMVLALGACGTSGTSTNTDSSSQTDTNQKADEGTTTTGEDTNTAAQEEDTLAGELEIYAANSLAKALPEVQVLYTSKHPGVTFKESQFLSSGDLVEKIAAGGQPDILITASKGSMDTAETNGSIDTATRATMFDNTLVVVTAQGSGITFADLADVTKEDITKIAIGDDSVPAGNYAAQSLNSIGLYDNADGKAGNYDASIADKIVLQTSVGNAAKAVSTGDCQIGFVYSSDVYRFDGLEVIYVVPDDSHKAIIYPGAVVTGSANAEVAADFLNFCITDPDAVAIFSKYGFELYAG